MSLLRRSFGESNSFNGTFGLAWNSTEVALGNDMLSKLGVSSASKTTLLRTDTLGINMALGNRWTPWKQFTIGSDWIGLSQPLLTVYKDTSLLNYAGNGSERASLEKALKVAFFFPRFYLLKIQAGMVF